MDFRNYESPFELPPDVPKCTSPRMARDYPRYHSELERDDYWGSPCPVHKNKKNAEIPEQPAAEWKTWSEYREKYATAETDSQREPFMRYMLECVTLTNPPDAKSEYPVWMKTDRVPARVVPNVLLIWAFVLVFATAISLAMAL